MRSWCVASRQSEVPHIFLRSRSFVSAPSFTGFMCQTSSMLWWIEARVSDYAMITGFLPLIHMHVCAPRICQCGSMASTDTRLMPSSRPSFLPPPGRLTPWRWTQICTPWKAPTGSWTSKIPAGALSARSMRPPYSEAGSPQLILYPPAHCLPPVLLPFTLASCYVYTHILTCKPGAFSL